MSANPTATSLSDTTNRTTGSTMKIQLHVTDTLGRSLTAETTLAELNSTMRELSAIGATSGNIVGSGLTLPYDTESDFDWSLIGARPWTNSDGEMGVYHGGAFYKRRVLDAVDTKKMKMPAVVKYSRGARPTDPKNIVEGEEGGVQYVSLIYFKGGKRQSSFAVPATPGRPAQRTHTPPPQPATEAPQTAPGTMGIENASKLQDLLRTRLSGTEFGEMSFCEYVAHVLEHNVSTLAALTIEDGRAVARAANALQAVTA